MEDGRYLKILNRHKSATV